MGILATKKHFEDEEEGKYPLQLIAARYTGSRSSLSVGNALNSQGGWPGTTALNADTWYFAFVPDDSRLAYLENRGDLELVYPDDQKRFAEILLGKTRLPPNAFSDRAKRDVQERVFDALDLKPVVEGGPIRDQLEAMAPDDVDTETDDDADKSRVQQLTGEYSRSELKEAVKAVRDDAGDFSLQGSPGKTDMAEFLAEQDAEDVAAALEDDADTEE